MHTTLPLGPVSQQTVVLEASLAERGGVEPAAGPCVSAAALALSIVEQTPASSADDYSPFKKQLLSCLGVFVETEGFPMGQLVTVCPEPVHPELGAG